MNLLNIADSIGLFAATRGVLKHRRNLIVMFHGTYPRCYEGIPKEFHFGMSVDEFERVLVWMRRQKLHLLTLAEYLAGQPGVLVTFDDGYANNVEYALPLLEKFECPAVFFIATKHLMDRGESKWLDYFNDNMISKRVKIDDEIGYELFYGLSQNHVRELSRHPLITIGAHSHRHVRLPRFGYAENKQDLQQCNRILEELTGSKPSIFSYPFGDYDRKTLNLVREFDYQAAFAVKPMLREDRQFELPRIGLYRADSEYLSAKLSFITTH